ncbi:squamous cell carcinoma antigen recognized by T-cells 3-like [Hydra vulgaris]|uniref:squamous cell carcinoma antigen recognized by T-cells 3-like n=1 Tax=Hydra vulgaris TaxID=6087 RepID=UPI0032E9E162
MSLFQAKGRYDRNLHNQTSLKIQYAEKDQINELKNEINKLNNQLSQYPTKSDVVNIKTELDQKCESLKKLTNKAEDKRALKKKEIKRSKSSNKKNYSESSEDEEEEEEEEPKPKRKVKQTSLSCDDANNIKQSKIHVCSQCLQEVNAVDAIHGMCRNCIVQQKAILSSPYLTNNSKKKKRKSFTKKI